LAPPSARRKTRNASACPWQKNCKAYALNLTDKIPVRVRKKATPVRYGVSYIVTDKQGRILMKQRPEKGLLGGLWGFADTNGATRMDGAEIKKHAPAKRNWQHCRHYPCLHAL
jgi:A/G-specific adenine glycosylase